MEMFKSFGIAYPPSKWNASLTAIKTIPALGEVRPRKGFKTPKELRRGPGHQVVEHVV